MLISVMSPRYCSNTFVGRMLSNMEAIINLYKSYVEKAINAESKQEFREYAMACEAVYQSMRLAGNSLIREELRKVMSGYDFLFTEYGRPDEGCYLLGVS